LKVSARAQGDRRPVRRRSRRSAEDECATYEAPVWLIGTSAGTQSVAYLAMQLTLPRPRHCPQLHALGL